MWLRFPELNWIYYCTDCDYQWWGCIFQRLKSFLLSQKMLPRRLIQRSDCVFLVFLLFKFLTLAFCKIFKKVYLQTFWRYPSPNLTTGSLSKSDPPHPGRSSKKRERMVYPEQKLLVTICFTFCIHCNWNIRFSPRVSL